METTVLVRVYCVGHLYNPGGPSRQTMEFRVQGFTRVIMDTRK